MYLTIAFCGLIAFTVLTLGTALHVIERLVRENRELKELRN